jgi:hypothetical protein
MVLPVPTKEAWKQSNVDKFSTCGTRQMTRTINSVDQGPAWETNSRSASQEIPRLFTEPEGLIIVLTRERH